MGLVTAPPRPLGALNNVVTVGPRGCMFTTVQAGVNAAIARFTCTADTPGIVLVYPGKYTQSFTHPTIGNRSIALDMSGPSTGADGQNGGGDFINIIGASGDPRDVIIEFTGIPLIGSINSRCIDAMAHTRIADVTLRCNLLADIEDGTNGVGRLVHFDSAGLTNYLDMYNVVLQSTTGIAGISTGIGAGQRIELKNISVEGAIAFSIHGRTAGGNATPGQVTLENIQSDGAIYTSAAGLKRQAGIEIDGQSVAAGAPTHPIHNLVVRLRRVSLPGALDLTAGLVGLEVRHPFDGGSGVGITQSSQASPSVITTAAAHGLQVGDIVVIGSHSISTMNGTWTVASTPSGTTFTATSCNNASGANGTATGSIYKQVQIASSTQEGAGVTVSSSTVASPSVVTTAAAHGLSVADVIVISGHSDPRMNGTWVVASTPQATTFTATGLNGLGDNDGTAGSGGSLVKATVVTTSSVHGLNVGDPVIIASHSRAAMNGNWMVTSVGSTTTFTAEGATDDTGGASAGNVTKNLSWIYVLDGGIMPNVRGIVGTRVYNHMHWPNKRRWSAKSGHAFKSGEVGVYDLTGIVESIGRVSAAGGVDWPVPISRPFGRDNRSSGYPKVNTGSHAHLLCTSAAVVIGDTLITGTTQGTVLTDNTVTLINNPQKIVGWAVTGKPSGQTGVVLVALNPLIAARW